MAAQSVKPANGELIERIRAVVAAYAPLTHDEIAQRVDYGMPGRWTLPTIVTACARADLKEWGHTTNARGRTVLTYALTSPAVLRITTTSAYL